MNARTQASTPVDQIQAQLMAVVGGDDSAPLAELVAQQLEVAERELEQIPERAAERGLQFLEQAGPALAEVLQQFRHYHSFLSRLFTALQIGDLDNCAELYAESQLLLPDFFQATEAYARLFASQGSYASPWVNALDRIAAGVRKGMVEEAHWQESLITLGESIQQKLEAARVLPLPGRSACQQAYQEAVESLTQLQLCQGLSRAEVDPLLAQLEEAILLAQDLEKLIQQGMDGPCAIPATNVVVAWVEAFLQGRQEREGLLTALQDYAELLEVFWEGFERSLARPSESVLIQQEIPRVLDSGDEHDAALESLVEALGQSPAAVRQSLRRLQASAAQLQESREVFVSAALHQSQIQCHQCGRANPPENRRCEVCGGWLTQEGGGSSTFSLLSGPVLEETQEVVMTENVARLFRACDEVFQGQISLGEFASQIEEAQGGLREFARELSDVADDLLDDSAMQPEAKTIWQQQHLPYVQEVGAHFVAGIQDCEEGLERLLDYLAEPQRECLIEGLQMIWEGLGVIHRARLSMNSNLQMFNDVLEECREKGLLIEEASAQES